MTVVRRTQQQRGRVHGATRDHDDVRRILLADAVALDDYFADLASIAIRFQTQDLRIRDQGNIWMFERRVDADRLRVRLRANQTRMTIARIAANAETLTCVLFVESNP